MPINYQTSEWRTMWRMAVCSLPWAAALIMWKGGHLQVQGEQQTEDLTGPGEDRGPSPSIITKAFGALVFWVGARKTSPAPGARLAVWRQRKPSTQDGNRLLEKSLPRLPILMKWTFHVLSVREGRTQFGHKPHIGKEGLAGNWIFWSQGAWPSQSSAAIWTVEPRRTAMQCPYCINRCQGKRRLNQ